MFTKAVTPKVNFLVKSKSETKTIPATMKCLFIFCYVVFALDFGFLGSQSQRMKRIVKMYSLAQASILVATLSYLFFYAYPDIYSAWYFIDAIIYYIFVIILLVSKNSYHDFQFDLFTIDNAIEADSYSHKVEFKMFFCLLIVLSFRCMLSVSYCIYYLDYCPFPIPVLCTYYIVMLGLNFVLIAYAFLFQSAYYRMKDFKSFVRNENSDIVSCHFLYKNLVEITEKAKRTFDLVLVLALVFNTVQVTVTIYVPIAIEISKVTNHSVSSPLAYLLVVQELGMMFAPAITAGLLSSQVESLKLVLYDRLVKDQKHAIDIKRFISYIEARPLHFKVWMVIPLDWSLPVIVVNITVTYLIVMIQFTHKD